MTVQEAINLLTSLNQPQRPLVVEMPDQTWADVESIQMQYDADMPGDGGAVVIRVAD